ncbi:MAG TPA: TetR/AcrR family transcriptional regulator [Steroidobacteraceae bacterium]|nr:TetR/AcrR family transcriptional regulator [Steroidobacteraceae bacterium]
MKVTKEKAAENRAALVRAASRLFRERGIDGVGVAEISKKAGLTHGALYAQFPSKEALAAEAFASSANRGMERMTAGRDGRPATLTDFLDHYLSFDHRDNLATSCPMSASASEIGRQDKVVGERFTEGFEQFVALIERGLGASPVKAANHQRALAMMAALIGGVAASRAVAKTNPKLSNEILQAVRRIVGEVGGEEGRVDGARGSARVTRKHARANNTSA